MGAGGGAPSLAPARFAAGGFALLGAKLTSRNVRNQKRRAKPAALNRKIPKDPVCPGGAEHSTRAEEDLLLLGFLGGGPASQNPQG